LKNEKIEDIKARRVAPGICLNIRVESFSLEGHGFPLAEKFAFLKGQGFIRAISGVSSIRL